jgi:formylglycine-generating enzyme required for sulfatase activity
MTDERCGERVDRWADRAIEKVEQDRLRFHHYRDVLVKVVREADTPITVGIFGPWGSGKTSLMRLVQESLESGRTTTHMEAHTVWFNAWKYHEEDALWRALIIRVLDELRPPTPHKGEKVTDTDIVLTEKLNDLESSLYGEVSRREVGGIRVDWEKLVKGTVSGLLHLSLNLVPGVGNFMTELIKAAQKEQLEDVSAILDAVGREVNTVHRDHIRSMEKFQEQFEGLVNEYYVKRNRLLVVFIDDLDRAVPEKAVEVLEAIKLFLDVPGVVFFVGADREVIAKGVQARYKGFLDLGAESYGERKPRSIPIAGDDYLEKIIQLPFHLLPLNENRITDYVNACAVNLPAGCAEVFVRGLAPIPRQVKRTLNIYRLVYELARLREQEKELFPPKSSHQLNPILLAKVVVIQNRWRDLYADIVEYPTLIQDLEGYFCLREQASISLLPSESLQTMDDSRILISRLLNSGEMEPLGDLAKKYVHLRPLANILRLTDGFSGLSEDELKTYLYLTYTATEQAGREVIDIDAQRWADLLSNDPTRFRTAVTAIRSEGHEREYAAQLAEMVQSIPLRPVEERFLACTALSYLGDLRPGVSGEPEMIVIPAGKFSYGKDRVATSVDAFSIGLYPVTNLQYQRFLNDTDRAVPFVDKAWAHLYNWDENKRTYPEGRANHPVVLVDLDDAQAYCKWLSARTGKNFRLLSEVEWEKAARGQDQEYPWPGKFDPSKANTSEWGIGGTTPVGIYPDGASPYGLLDCAGNVLEWTADEHESGGNVLRGGSWSHSQFDARCAARARYFRTQRESFIGFRVAY